MNFCLNLCFFLLLMTPQLVFSQNSEIEEISKKDIFLVSCNHPIINKASQSGLASLKIKEIPSFIFFNIKCKVQARRENIKLKKSNLFKEKQTFQHNLNKKISGPGALIASLSSLILFYTYIGLIANSQ